MGKACQIAGGILCILDACGVGNEGMLFQLGVGIFFIGCAVPGGLPFIEIKKP